MATGKISTLLWDCGGVLLTNGWDHRERAAVLAQFPLDTSDIGAFEQRHPEANDLWEKDEISIEQYLERTIFYRERNFSRAQFIAAMQAQSVILHSENMDMAAALATTGKHRMALLNNEARELNDYRIRTFGLQQYFSNFFSSCYMGQRKPGAAIFQRALDILQCEPDEAVFIDDRKENAAAASALGIQAIYMHTPAQLRDELRRLGVSAERA